MLIEILLAYDIGKAYALITGRGAAADGCVVCPLRTHHHDARLQLSYDSRSWVCASCCAAGNVLDLVVAAGCARDIAEAAQWLAHRLGLFWGSDLIARTSVPR